jgi:glycyl-tRNA synthetase beta chain
MGGIYAREEGLPEEVWKAVYFHYLPVGVEANAPPTRAQLGKAAVAWAAVALADKLDTVTGLHASGERFSGSRDPYGIRRQAHGVIRILIDLPELTGLQKAISLKTLIEKAGEAFAQFKGTAGAEFEPWGFWDERLRFVLEHRGAPHEHVGAVQATSDYLTPLSARGKAAALPEFAASAAFTQLATTFKRVKNIAKELKTDPLSGEALKTTLTEPSEKGLLADLQIRAPKVREASARRDYRSALAELAAFGPLVDRFFTEVLVMADDPQLRHARLSLMAHLRDVVLTVVDPSEIVADEAAKQA